MKHAWPLAVIICGILIIFGGFVYDVLFAGIPYQDPTPELTARYTFHAGVAAMIGWSGLAVCVVGVAAWLIHQRNRQKK